MSEHNFPDIHIVLRRLRVSRLPFNLRLVARIEDLAAAFADDYEGRQISARSLAGLIDYLEASPLVGYPDLTLTPTGDCYAEWRDPHAGKIVIEFSDSGGARRWSENLSERN
jgi:hypothetical protein